MNKPCPLERPGGAVLPKIGPFTEPVVIVFAQPDIYLAGQHLFAYLTVATMIGEDKPTVTHGFGLAVAFRQLALLGHKPMFDEKGACTVFSDDLFGRFADDGNLPLGLSRTHR